VNPSKLAREMLERTRLTSIFNISSVEDAPEILRNVDSTIENVNRAVA